MVTIYFSPFLLYTQISYLYPNSFAAYWKQHIESDKHKIEVKEKKDVIKFLILNVKCVFLQQII